MLFFAILIFPMNFLDHVYNSYNITIQNCPIYDHMTGLKLIGSDLSWKNIYNIGDTVFAKDQSDSIYMWGLLEKDYSDSNRRLIDSPTKTNINTNIVI